MTHRMVRFSGLVGTLAVTLALASCGGGGGDSSFDGGSNGGGSGGGGGGGGLGSSYTPGVFQPSSNFAGRCTAPRSGTNPATGRPYPDGAERPLLWRS